MSTPAVTPNPDKLSGGDMSALVETYQHLKQANDPRADKLATFIGSQVRSGNVEPLDSSNPDHAPALYGFTLPNIAKNLYAGGKSVVTGAYDLGKDIVSNPNWVMGPNSTYEKFIGAPAAAEAQKASDQFKQGNYVQAAGHELAGAIPLVGPAAAQIGEQAGSGDVGGAAAKGVAQAVTPIAIAKGAGLLRSATAPLARAVSEKMYQSALKPSTTYSPEEVKSMVQTGLQNEIPVSEGGAAKLGDLIKDLNTKIAAEIASKPGATVDPNSIAQRLQGTQSRFANQVTPEADLAAINATRQEFMRRQGARPGTPASPPQPTGILDDSGRPIMNAGSPATPATPAKPMLATDAQAMKQGTYQQLKDKSYGELQSATKEAQKALARGIKEELVTQFPELKDLNAQDSKLYGLDDAMERAVNRIGNHNVISLGGKVVSGTLAGAATGHVVGGAAVGLVIHEVLTNPALQTKLAISLSRASKGTVTLPVARARLANYVSGLAAAGAANADNPANPTN